MNESLSIASIKNMICSNSCIPISLSLLLYHYVWIGFDIMRTFVNISPWIIVITIDIKFTFDECSPIPPSKFLEIDLCIFLR